MSNIRLAKELDLIVMIIGILLLIVKNDDI